MVKTLKPVDPRRIFLTNVPLPIEQELLEIYLEYLSGEENIEVETVHLGDEIRNSILVTYSTSVDFEGVRLNHKRKSTIMGTKTGLHQVYLPNIILVEVDRIETMKNIQMKESELERLKKEFFNKEFLELYFSNKKRSGGEKIRSLLVNADTQRAYILFENSDITSNVVNRKHLIKDLVLNVKPYFENIGSLPYLRCIMKKTPHRSAKLLNSSSSSRLRFSKNDKIKRRNDRSRHTVKRQSPLTVEIPVKSKRETPSKLDTYGKIKFNQHNTETYRASDTPTINHLSILAIAGRNKNDFDTMSQQTKNKIAPYVKDIIFDLTESSSVNNEKEEDEDDDSIRDEQKLEGKIKNDLLKKPMVNLPRLDNAVLLLDDFKANRQSNYQKSRETPPLPPSVIHKTILNVKPPTPRPTATPKPQVESVPVVKGVINQISTQPATSSGTPVQLRPPKVIVAPFIQKENKPPLPKIVRLKESPAVFAANGRGSVNKNIIIDRSSLTPSYMSMMRSNQQQNRKSLVIRLPPPPKVVSRPNSVTKRASSTVGSINMDRNQINSAIPPFVGLKEVDGSSNMGLEVRAKSCYPVHLKSNQVCVTVEPRVNNNNNNQAANNRLIRLKSNSFIGSGQVPRSIIPTPFKAGTPVKLAIVSHYGHDTLAESSNKLNSSQIEYIQNNYLVDRLKHLYPKTSITLDPRVARVYFFGDKSQVVQAKERLKNDIKHLAATSTMNDSVNSSYNSANSANSSYSQQSASLSSSNGGGIISDSSSNARSSVINEVALRTLNLASLKTQAHSLRGNRNSQHVVSKEPFNNFINSLLLKYN